LDSSDFPLGIVVHEFQIRVTFVELQVDLFSVICPRAENDDAVLHVKGPVVKVDLAERVELGGRNPQHLAIVLDDAMRVAVVVYFTALGTEN